MNGTNWNRPLGDGTWFKSSFSEPQGSCVEVKMIEGEVAVRHSKDPDSPVLRFTAKEWTAFLDGVFAGEFDLS